MYTDFAKAFDRGSHRFLISKLHKLGFKNDTVKRLSSFLLNRSQQVRISNFVYAPFSVPSGVSQGTHCGPILFVLFTNDLTSCFRHSNYLLYADDLRLFKVIPCIHDAQLLQLVLENLLRWRQKLVAVEFKKMLDYFIL